MAVELCYFLVWRELKAYLFFEGSLFFVDFSLFLLLVSFQLGLLANRHPPIL